MKQVVLMSIGAAVLYQIVKKNQINSLGEVRKVLNQFLTRTSELMNTDKIKELLVK